MKKLSINLPVVFIIFAIIVVGILAYISILGENDKINRIIDAYFDKLKDGMYLEACEGFSSNFHGGQVSSDEQRMNFNFLVESTLLTHYHLIDSKDYEVELKRSHFWLPYMGSDVVRASVLLKKKEARRFFLPRSNDQGSKPVNDLIVMTREKGTWKIKEFALADSSVAGIYSDLRQNLDLNKYVTMTTDGFRFNNADINFKTLTPIDKRLLNFSLYKMQKLLGEPRKKTKPSLMHY
jgi:hypothetical protein